MSATNDRRGFLHGLVTLPLIGGSVALIGRPAAVAEAPDSHTLGHYANWLLHERRILCYELAKGDFGSAMAIEAAGMGWQPEFHYPRFGYWQDVPMPSTRAALVMATVGFNWKE